MENLKIELSEKLDKITSIYVFTQEVYLYTEYFHNPNTKEELHLLVNSVLSTHLSFIAHTMFRTLINELSKLFSSSKSDKYRLIAFIESLSKDGYYKKLSFPNEQINLWKSNFNKQQGVIKKVLHLRNKIYAHTDFSTDLSSIDITFKEIKTLLDFALEIIKDVDLKIFNRYFDEESAQFDRKRFLLIRLLAKGETQRIEELASENISTINNFSK